MFYYYSNFGCKIPIKSQFISKSYDFSKNLNVFNLLFSKSKHDRNLTELNILIVYLLHEKKKDMFEMFSDENPSYIFWFIIKKKSTQKLII